MKTEAFYINELICFPNKWELATRLLTILVIFIYLSTACFSNWLSKQVKKHVSREHKSTEIMCIRIIFRNVYDPRTKKSTFERI